MSGQAPAVDQHLASDVTDPCFTVTVRATTPEAAKVRNSLLSIAHGTVADPRSHETRDLASLNYRGTAGHWQLLTVLGNLAELVPSLVTIMVHAATYDGEWADLKYVPGQGYVTLESSAPHPDSRAIQIPGAADKAAPTGPPPATITQHKRTQPTDHLKQSEDPLSTVPHSTIAPRPGR